MSVKERKRVKKASKHLLEVLKMEKLVLDWRKHQSTRAGVKVAIEKILDIDLPEIYDTNLFNEKSEMFFQHVYDSYYGAGKSVFGGIA
ncbi:MAG: hypothetical protein KAR44_12510 [Candidatus Aegiribacteria sp.]|nr:hypothetical protein [Candidatus Aegiribacteria sp.]